jgi:hypothetical protein
MPWQPPRGWRTAARDLLDILGRGTNVGRHLDGGFWGVKGGVERVLMEMMDGSGEEVNGKRDLRCLGLVDDRAARDHGNWTSIIIISSMLSG